MTYVTMVSVTTFCTCEVGVDACPHQHARDAVVADVEAEAVEVQHDQRRRGSARR